MTYTQAQHDTWECIRQDYICHQMTYRQLCRKYGPIDVNHALLHLK